MRHLIPHFIYEQYKQQSYQGQFYALTMFMDISGFTVMTEALMKYGKDGAEVLSGILNDVFQPVINTVYYCGGFISGFAGDAFIAIFPIPPEGEQPLVSNPLPFQTALASPPPSSTPTPLPLLPH